MDGGTYGLKIAKRIKFQNGRLRAAIINKLRSAEGAYVPMTELIEYVYAGDEPEQAEDCIIVTMCALRKLGYPIGKSWGRASRGYRFVPRNERRIIELGPLAPTIARKRDYPRAGGKLVLIPGKALAEMAKAA